MMKHLAVAVLVLSACCARPAAAANYCTGYASTLSFGNDSPSSAVTVTTTVTVICSMGLAYRVGLSAGYGSGGTTTTRIMNSGQNLMGYKLFQDSARTINWGNNPPTDTLNGTGTGSAQVLTVYGTLPAGQYVAPGSYSDTITVYITSSASPSSFQFGVNATVLSTCAVSATALNFGTYAGALINNTSVLTVTCTNTTVFNIGLNAGTATGATVTTRKMTGPASATLNYKLFRDGALTQNWGNTVGTDTLLSQSNGTALQYSVFGQMPAGQSLKPGSYTDTITATVTY